MNTVKQAAGNVNHYIFAIIAIIIISYISYIIYIIGIKENNLEDINKLISKANNNNNSLNFGDLIICNNGEFIKKASVKNSDISYSFKLKDYYIKTAYNACCTGRFKNDYVDLKALENCAVNGVRGLDFEIYSLNDEPIIGASSNNDYYYKETYNHVNLKSAMTEVNTRFVEGGEYNDYPLFLFFRINYGGNNSNDRLNINNQSNDYDNKLINFYNTIYDTLNSSFGNNIDNFYSKKNETISQIRNNDNDIFKLDLKASMIANTNIEDTKNTIFLFIETNENNHDNLKRSKLGRLIDIVIDDSKMRLYRYNDLEGNDSLMISNNNKESLSICLPNYGSSSNNYNPTKPITLGVQFIAMNYQNSDNNLVEYNNLFNLSGCGGAGIENNIPLLKKPNKYIEVPNKHIFNYYKNLNNS